MVEKYEKEEINKEIEEKKKKKRVFKENKRERKYDV